MESQCRCIKKNVTVDSSNDNKQDDLNFFEDGRRPQFIGKRKMKSICCKTEVDLNFWQIEEDLNFFILM